MLLIVLPVFMVDILVVMITDSYDLVVLFGITFALLNGMKQQITNNELHNYMEGIMTKKEQYKYDRQEHLGKVNSVTDITFGHVVFVETIGNMLAAAGKTVFHPIIHAERNANTGEIVIHIPAH